MNQSGATPPEGIPELSVEQGYDRWSETYDHDGNPLVALEQRVVAALLGAVGDRAVLDLGCGTGRHALPLARSGARVVAMDLSAGMLEQARRKAAGLTVQWLQHDLSRPFPVTAATFDLAVSGLVLEHLRDLGGFYREVARALRPGGRAVLSTIHPAMALRNVQARFTDPATGVVQHVASRPQSFAELLLPARRTGLELVDLQEHSGDEALAAAFPRAAKYLGWPMLAVLQFERE